jgi:Phage capsid family
VRSLVRACIATARGKSSQKSLAVSEIVRRTWPNDETARLITRASSEPPATISGIAALARIVLPDFVAAMTPYSAAAALIDAGLQFTFDTAAYISVPSFAAIPTGVAYCGEAQPIPVQQYQESAPPPLTPKKLASIVVLSEELINSSNAETLVQDVLLRSVGLAVDGYLFSNAAATANQPPGLLNGVASTPPSGLQGIEGMVADMSKLAGAVANVGGRIAFIMSPSRAVNIHLRSGYPLSEYRQVDVLMSAAIPDNEIVCVAVVGFVTAMDAVPEIRASRDATIHMETQPAPIASPGSPASVAAPTRGLFQTRSVGLLLRFPLDWALRSPNAVAWMTGCAW